MVEIQRISSREKGFDAPAFDEDELKNITQSVLDANESVVEQTDQERQV